MPPTRTVATTSEAARVVASSDIAHRRYQRETPPISAETAEAEPVPERMYAPMETEELPDLRQPAPPPAPARPLPTFTIHALIDDFPFDVQFSGSADQLAATVKRLRAIGAVPPTQAARAAVEEERKREAPVCEYHGPMKESSKRPGTYYCPAKMGDNSYCKSKG